MFKCTLWAHSRSKTNLWIGNCNLPSSIFYMLILKNIALGHWFPNLDYFAQGHWAIAGDIWERASSGQRSRLLLNILGLTGQPLTPTRIIQPQMSIVLRLKTMLYGFYIFVQGWEWGSDPKILSESKNLA